jgi:glucose-6-phosphate-specific signal transduction histidine kinase
LLDETDKRAEEELRRRRSAPSNSGVRKRIASDLRRHWIEPDANFTLRSRQPAFAGRDGAVAQLAQIANSSRAMDAMSASSGRLIRRIPQRSDTAHADLTSEVSTACGITASVFAPEVDEDLPLGANLRREVFLIFKESINNIVKHSGATEAEVEFRFDKDQLFLRVSDDGHGFDLAAENEGHGLISMRSRAKEMGARFEMQSSIGKGTVMILTVPLSEAP